MDEACSVHTLPELASEQVDPHDAEDEPEDETHEQHIHNGGDGSYKSVHHHLMCNGKDAGQSHSTDNSTINHILVRLCGSFLFSS